ncbi:hypothetical protein D3C71_1411970 [compost metagenome]
MLGPMKGKKGCAKLPDAAQPLKFLGVDQTPNNRILHMNIIMNRIFEYFFFGKRLLRHRFSSFTFTPSGSDYKIEEENLFFCRKICFFIFQFDI